MKCSNGMIKTLLIIIPVVLLIIIPTAYGSEIAVPNYTAINNIQSETCHGIGYIDGKDNPFDQEMLDRCGDSYYRGFIDGCMSANNSREICEQVTDSE